MRTAAAAATFLLVFQGSVVADWNQWRGPDRDGRSPESIQLIESLPADGVAPLWKSETIPSAGSGGWSSPVVADGKVYAYAHIRSRKQGVEGTPERKYPWLSEDKRGHLTDEEFREYEVKRREEDLQIAQGNFDFRESIYCFDLNDGATLWKSDVESVYTRFLQSGTPCVVDGSIYILGAGRVARCFDAKSGELKWETRLPGEFRDEFMMSSFTVVDGVAVVLCGWLFGLDADTGSIRWQGDERGTRGTHSSPAVWSTGDRNLIVCNVAGSKTVCIDPADGSELWRVDSQAGLSTPIVHGDLLITYGNSRKKGVRCFEMSLDGADERWVNNTVADKGSSPVLVDGHVYVQGERRMVCIDLETGKTTWRTLLDLDTPQYTSLVAVGDRVLYAHDGVLCFAAEPKRFTPVFQAKIDEDGLLATEETLKKKHGIDDAQAQDAERAQQLYRRKIGRQGPLRCTSPALAGGKIVLRRPDGVICYDLSASSDSLVRKDAK